MMLLDLWRLPSRLGEWLIHVACLMGGLLGSCIPVRELAGSFPRQRVLGVFVASWLLSERVPRVHLERVGFLDVRPSCILQRVA